RADRRDRRFAPAPHRPARRGGRGHPDARRRPREPRRAPDDAPRPREWPRLRLAVDGARARPRGDRPRISRPGRREAEGGDRVMIWLSWRQQRTETIVTAALLALLAVAFVPEGIHLADSFAQQHVARCINRQTQACSFVVGNFTASAGALQALFDGG